MREVTKMEDDLFGEDRLTRIEALRKVISRTSLIPSKDRQLIADALRVHSNLIRILRKEEPKT